MSSQNLTVWLPYPPSVNSHWQFGKGKMYLSSASVKFRRAVWQALLEQHGTQYRKFGENLIWMRVQLSPPDKRKRDIDGPIKELLDSLAEAKVYADDCQIKNLSVQMNEPAPDDPGCWVMIGEWDTP